MKKKTLSIADFENALNRLNEIIDKMEAGQLSLEASMQHFEEGVALIQSCQKTLATAEQKVQTLIEQDD